MKELRDSFKDNDYIKKYSDKIEELYINDTTEPLIMHWILSLDEAMNLLFEFIEEVEKRKIIMRRKYGDYISKFNDTLMIIMKAVFLVLYRIVEQNYFIINEKELDIDEAINLLIEDIVYLDNIEKSIIYDLLK